MGFFIYLFAFSYAFCNISLRGEVGLKQYRGYFSKGSEICINITSFDYFLIIEEIKGDTLITEYRSILHTYDLSIYKQTYASTLDSFSHIPIPFASQTITINSDGIISFTYGSLGNFCKTGVFYSNSQQTQINLHNNAEPPYDLSELNDKCLVFTSQGIH